MLNIRKYIKVVFVFIFAAAIFLAICQMTLAKDFSTPHYFKDGDVISADVINEMFQSIERTKKYISMSDIIGTWECVKFMAYVDSYSDMIANYTPADQDGLWYYLNIDVTFSDDGDDTYSWSSEGFNAFTYGASTLDNCDGSGKISLYNGRFAITATECGSNPITRTEVYVIKRISNSRIDIGKIKHGDIVGLICDKSNTPPDKPTNLNATVSGFTVSLSWKDNSDDETGFKVTRKDFLKGTYSLIDTTAENVTSYDDTVSAAGDYWYRVAATNDNGDSLGSNVVRVAVKE